jgi:hypothetical protein
VPPEDDPTVLDDWTLWRRVHPRWIIFDANLNRKRPSSAAFEDDIDGSSMSVVIAEEAARLGRNQSHVLQGHDSFGLAGVAVRTVRACNQIVNRAPKVDEPAHALVIGRKTDSVRKRLWKNSFWVSLPV